MRGLGTVNVLTAGTTPAWQTGVALASGFDNPVGITVKQNGDVVVLDSADGISTYSGGSWSTPIALPILAFSPQGIAVKPNGDIVVVHRDVNNGGKIFTYDVSASAWNPNSFPIPSTLTHVSGIAVKPNGDTVVVDYGTDKFYTLSGIWDAGVALPSGVSVNAQGIAVNHDGDILVVFNNINRYYKYDVSAGTWDSGTTIVTATGHLLGIAVAPDQDIYVVRQSAGSGNSKFYRYAHGNPTWTLPDIAGTTPIGTVFRIDNPLALEITLDGNSTDTVNGAATDRVASGEAVLIQAVTATAWRTVASRSLFDAAARAKLASLNAGAEENVNADWNATSGDALILNKPNIAGIGVNYQVIHKTGDVTLVAGEAGVGRLVRMTAGPTGAGWDVGTDIPTVPSNVNIPRGVAAKANGDVLIVDDSTNKYYTWSETTETWDAGTALPASATTPVGIAVDSSGNVYIVDHGDEKFYKRTASTGNWDSGVALPSGIIVSAIAVKSNGDVLVQDVASPYKYYIYSGGAWDTGTNIVSGATKPQGIAVDSTGDVYVVDDTTKRVYKHDVSAGTWDAGFLVPSNATEPSGLTLASNGDVIIVDSDTDKFYRYSAAAPARWTLPDIAGTTPIGTIYRLRNAASVNMIVQGHGTSDSATGDQVNGEKYFIVKPGTTVLLQAISGGHWENQLTGTGGGGSGSGTGEPRGAGDGLVLDGTSLDVNPGDGIEIATDKVRVKLDGATLTRGSAGLAVANPFTTADENKLDAIQAGAEANVKSDWNASSGDAQILNKPTIPGSAVVDKTADYTLLAADKGKTIRLTGTTARTFTLPDISGSTAVGTSYWLLNNATGVNLTVATNGSDTVDGAATLTLKPGEAVQLQAVTATAWAIVAEAGRAADFSSLRLPSFIRDVAGDISPSVLRSASNTITPIGITYDGTRLLILDGNNDSVWGFTLAGARDTAGDIPASVLRSASATIDPAGITYDGTRLRIIDVHNDAVWGFTLAGARDTAGDITTSVLRSANATIDPTGITYDGIRLRIVDKNGRAVWGFTLAGARDTAGDITTSVLRSGNYNISPTGITYDGTRLRVTDGVTDAVWGFTLVGARDTAGDIPASVLRSASDTIHPEGITYDGTRLRITDTYSDAVFGFSDRLMTA